MKKHKWIRGAIFFLSGVLFALGLGIAGMTDPNKVIGFLDITGKWDATLLTVLGAATGTNLILFRLIFKRDRPIFGELFSLPTKTQVDKRLVIGSMLFGIGWGISGLCPGPAITSMASGLSGIFIFVASMAFGHYLFHSSLQLFQKSKASKSSEQQASFSMEPQAKKAA